MRVKHLHDWDLTPTAAVALQRKLASKVRATGPVPPCRLVAGADVSYDHPTNTFIAAVVLWDPRTDEVVEEVIEQGTTPFPYVPGLLSFREAPVVLQALKRVRGKPDLLICDAHGIAHPRRFGLACHLGLHLDIPVIGAAKKRLVGDHLMPGPRRGSATPVTHRGERIGTVLRTRTDVKPMFVSPGHRIGMAETRRAVLKCCRNARMPRPTGLADRAAARVRKHGA